MSDKKILFKPRSDGQSETVDAKSTSKWRKRRVMLQ
jgi:hypothetical protein